MCDEAIDAVVTWVDSSCPIWKAARQVYASDQQDCFFTPPDHPDAEVDLCISLLLQNLPWLRCIWLVTMRPQQPKCMLRSEFRQRVKIIHHDEFMSKNDLPTFNSFAIEANIWKIKDLSERFVYLNDDFYILRPMTKENFFKFRTPRIWVSKPVPNTWRTKYEPYEQVWFTLKGSLTGARLLHHAPFSLTKTMLESAELHFGELWLNTSMSKTRTIEKNIPPIGAAINFAIQKGAVAVEKLPKTLFKEAVIKSKTVDVLLAKGAFFLCVNRQPFSKTLEFCDAMRKRLLHVESQNSISSLSSTQRA